MKPLLRWGLAAALGFAMCAQAEPEKKEAFKLIHTTDLVELQKGKAPVYVYDANDPGFRKKEGVISGAKLLSSFDKFDAAKELPPAKDAKLVFYCANTH